MSEDIKQGESVDESKAKQYVMTSEQILELKAENERLKAFHDEVVKEKKEAVAKAKEEVAKAAKEKAEQEGNYKELLALREKEYNDQLELYKSKITEYDNNQKENMLRDTAMKIANDLAKSNVKKAETLGNILKSRLKLTEDGVKVTDSKGNIISEKLETLTEFAKKEYDFLCDGVQSTGGAGVAVVKPTGVENQRKLSPIDRMNKARNI